MRRNTTLGEPPIAVDADRASYQRKLLLVVMLSVMAFGSLMTIVTVSLNLLAEDLQSSRSVLTWTITGLMVAVAVTTPIGGKLGDLYGHKRMLLVGLAGGAIMTVACAFAWDAASLIAFRVLFGVFGGLVNPNAMSLMIHAYGDEGRAKALGWFNFAMTGSPVIGVVISGPLIDSQGWRPVFGGFAVITGLAFFVAAVVARPTPRQAGAPLDIAGAFTLALGVLTGLLTISRFLPVFERDGAVAALTDPLAIGLIVLCVSGISAFIAVERRTQSPLLNLKYFGRRNFTLPMVAAALTQFAYMGGFVVTPALLDQRYGWTVGGAALLIAFRPAAFSGASILGGRMPSVIGLRKPIIIGSLLMISSMISFTVASSFTSFTGIALIAAGLGLSGMASGVSQPSVAATMVGNVDTADMGVANGMNQQVTMIGIVCGIQTMSVMLGDSPATSSGRFAFTYAFGGLIALLGLVAAFMTREQSLADRAPQPDEEAARQPVGAPAPRSARVA